MPRLKQLAIVSVLAALALTPPIASGSATRAATNTTTYPDSIGEDVQAPDITSTTVANDDTGLITFRIAIGNRSALTDDMLIEVLVDSDRNAATGDAQALIPGNDYLIQLVPGEVDLFSWSGTTYNPVTAPSLVYAYDSSGATLKVNAGEFGKTKAFNFAVVVLSGITVDTQGNPDFTNDRRDTSPDPGHGAFSYEVRVTVKLSVTAFTTSPKTVMAGKPFSAGLAATESDTGGPVRQGTGTVTCTARVGDKLLRPKTSRIVNGVAACVWTAPRTAKGRRIAGTVTLATQGAKVTRSFSVRVA